MAIIDRIKYDGPQNGGQWLIYKYPSEEFVLGSQLVVNQGQEALFFKGGKALDLFGPGTHTLSTGNLPILKSLVKLPFGGKTPFTAEIYYINKTVNMDMKWGTSSPIALEDVKYGLILNICARGQYGISIPDSRLFVTRLVGAVPHGTTSEPVLVLKYFSGLINTKTKTIIAQYMIQKQISFLEVSQYLSELSDVFKEKLDEEFERFGMELTNFHCVAIEPKEEDYERLREHKQELALGERFYQQRRTLDIAEKMAENPSTGGIANAGIGLGMGLGIAGQVGNIFSEVGQNLNTNTQRSNMNSRGIDGGADTTIVCPKCGANNNANMKYCGNCGMELSVKKICPHCGREVPINMNFCGYCGETLVSPKCPECGFENEKGMKFCGNCGRKL